MSEAIRVEWHSDVASDIAEAVGEVVEPGKFLNSVWGSREGGIKATHTVVDHADLLTLAGDALAERRPDEVPQRDDFVVVAVDVEVDNFGHVIIEPLDGGDD